MNYQKQFIEFCLKKNVLQFGMFTLKSGRTSPYFFNSGMLSTGKDIMQVGLFYAHSIMQSKIKFDILFGPAYKGIPIVVATSIALQNHYNLNVSYVFNRKENKTYGEKGCLIGSRINNKKIIILDDVFTSGTAILHAIEMIQYKQPHISTVFVFLDRQEKRHQKYNIHNINTQQNYKIMSIITVTDLIRYLLQDSKFKKYVPDIIRYQNKYGINSKI